jgi:hypothetical protein
LRLHLELDLEGRLMRFPRFFAILLLAAAGGFQGLSLASAKEGFSTYTNGRFGFGLDYPVPLLNPGIAPVNGDGLKFVSDDKQTTLEAYGSIAPESATIKSLYQAAIKDYIGKRVTYTRQKGNWFVISGFVADQLIFYRGGMLYRAPAWSATPGAMIFANFEIAWPEARRAVVDKKIGHMLRSFLRSPKHQQ